MTNALKKAWTDLVRPILRRPPERQVAALCYRDETDRGRQILLITSRGTGRWIIPKGWPIAGKTTAESALVEAWEEAGVKDCAIMEGPLGSFVYDKRMDEGYDTPVSAEVFRVRVGELADIYPESRERKRRWVAPAEAAEMVQEPGLKAILRRM